MDVKCWTKHFGKTDFRQQVIHGKFGVGRSLFGNNVKTRTFSIATLVVSNYQFSQEKKIKYKILSIVCERDIEENTEALLNCSEQILSYIFYLGITLFPKKIGYDSQLYRNWQDWRLHDLVLISQNL